MEHGKKFTIKVLLTILNLGWVYDGFVENILSSGCTIHVWLSQYSMECISRCNLFKWGYRRSCKSAEISLCCQQSFLIYRMCVQSLVLGHTVLKCIFPKRDCQYWHPRLNKLKHLVFSKWFNDTHVFLCFQGYYEYLQILLNKVTLITRFSSIVLSLTSHFLSLCF